MLKRDFMKLYFTWLFFSMVATSPAQVLNTKMSTGKLSPTFIKDTFNLKLLYDTTQYISIYSANGTEDFTSDQSKKLDWLKKDGVMGIFNKKYTFLGYLKLRNDSLLFIKDLFPK